MMDDHRPSQSGTGRSGDSKGEFVLIGVLAVFVAVAFVVMLLIEHYGSESAAPRPAVATSSGR